MEKYYTPKIEEFHVGFEYERKEHPQLESSTWQKHTFDNTNDIYGGYEGETELSEISFNNVEVRVKYLDKEDIESLGFKHEGGKLRSGAKQLYSKGNVGLIHFADKNEIGTFTKDLSKCDLYSQIHVDPISTNRITIKNKSELKKLLKQLNVEYND